MSPRKVRSKRKELDMSEKKVVVFKRQRLASVEKEFTPVKKFVKIKTSAKKSLTRNCAIPANKIPVKKETIPAKRSFKKETVTVKRTSVKRASQKTEDKDSDEGNTINIVREAASKKICLNQKVVLQFLKKARGSLSRKLSANDPSIILSKESNGGEKESGLTDDDEFHEHDIFGTDDYVATDEDNDYVGADYDDYDNDKDSDQIEPLFIVREKKGIAASKKTWLDQKVVLKFLKNAKGSLNRKLSANDPSIILSKKSNEEEKKTEQPKLAPIFVSKRTKQPDKGTLLAPKNFLESAVPEVVKKMVDIQKLAEEQEHTIFPAVSHTQQKEDNISSWNLPNVEVKFSCGADHPLCTNPKMPVGVFVKHEPENFSKAAYSASRPPRIKEFHDFLYAIKSECPDFPVYRIFRQLFAMSHPQQSVILRKSFSVYAEKGSSLARKKEQGDSVQNWGIGDRGCPAWTAKYQPTSSSDILGNASSVGRFKKWLELWVQVQENNFRKNFKDDVGSDEFFNDANDDDSSKPILPKNTTVLVGPAGSGKTMTVYTLAHELGYKILEVNAASKRTGHRILSELMEATQSHQVHGKGKSEKGKLLKKEQSEQQKSKLSLILVEDMDVIFEEQDDGFVSALTALVAGSKRPVVLVTSDPSCPHLSHFLEKSLVFEFKPAPCKLIGVWLQLVCLVEGVRVRRTCVEELWKHNNGDLRTTLLQLQFWVLSGGNNLPTIANNVKCHVSFDLPDYPNDVWNSSLISVDMETGNEVSYPFHSHCLATFLETDPQLLPVDRGKIWWNVPHLMGLPQISLLNLGKQEKISGTELNKEIVCSETVVSDVKNSNVETRPSEGDDTDNIKWKSVCSSEDLAVAVQLADALSAVESISCISGLVGELECCAWEKNPVDSLSLSEDMRTCTYGMEHTTKSIGRWLVSCGIEQCIAQLCPGNLQSQMSVLQRQPLKQEISWREQQHNVSRELEDAVAMQSWPQRRAMAEDYVPCLRYISRLEQRRICANGKRNNRFFHYLKGLGIDPSLSVLDAASNAFKFNVKN